MEGVRIEGGAALDGKAVLVDAGEYGVGRGGGGMKVVLHTVDERAPVRLLTPPGLGVANVEYVPSHFALQPCELRFDGSQAASGGFSVVRRAHLLGHEAPVAVKEMRKCVIDAEERRCLQQELRILQRLEHPNVVKMLGAFEDQDTISIVMEYVGGCLDDVMDDVATLPEPEARHIIRGVAAGLQHLHESGVVHCDIKPTNVLLLERHQAKICDFGLAEAAPDGTFRSRGVRGTPGFMAPEVYKADTLTSAVDMWSLGVVAYKLLAGYEPAANASFPDVFWKDVSPQGREFVAACLERDPARRLTSSEALAHPWMAPALAA